jgi:hypothetical protein
MGGEDRVLESRYVSNYWSPQVETSASSQFASGGDLACHASRRCRHGLLEPVTEAAVGELAAAGIEGQIEVLLADAGYWASEQIENLAARGIQPLVPPDGQNPGRIGSNRKGPRYDFMRRVIASDHGRVLYSKRKHAIEPVFGQIKHNRRITRFQRSGIAACRSKWRLIAATHNLSKLWRANSAPAAA